MTYTEAAKRIRIHARVLKSQELRTVSITEALDVAAAVLEDIAAGRPVMLPDNPETLTEDTNESEATE